MRAAAIAGALLALTLGGIATSGPAPDRRERFGELARHYLEPDADARVLAGLLELIDDEVIESLRTGGPFASPAFIQERLEGFTAEWGGLSFQLVQPAPRDPDRLTVALGTVMRGEPRGWLRIYGAAHGEAVRLAAIAHDGVPEFHAWPIAGDGSRQFLVSWRGTPNGRGSRPMSFELWRLGGRAGATRVWTSDDLFVDGVSVIAFAAKNGQLQLRYEMPYAGWLPGCDAQTLQEDTYQPWAGSARLALARRRVIDGWHRELHATVMRFFAALAARDTRTLGELVVDASLRRRLPSTLRAEAACDERLADGSDAVIVAATDARNETLAPWSLTWRRSARGWRLTSAGPVLQ